MRLDIQEMHTAFPEASIEYDTGETIIGNIDIPRMSQVFSNIVGNAVRHGNLKQPIYVKLYRDGDNAVFTVQNHGEVIPASVLPHLFTPGSRHSAYAAKEKGPSAGLGLGLYIASEIVVGHGGRIEAESTPDKGTTFSVILPIR